MKDLFFRWYKKYFSSAESIVLLIFILGCILVLNFFGSMLAPLLASIIIAYLLDWIVGWLQFIKLPRLLSVIIVYLLFIGIVVWILFSLIPLLWAQLATFVDAIPSMHEKGEGLLEDLIKKYPDYFSKEMLENIFHNVRSYIALSGQKILTASLSNIPNVIAILVYLFLVPLLVLFMLIDKKTILHWLSDKMPENSSLIKTVWADLDHGIGNYIRGRVIEIIIVSLVSYVAFYMLNLQYSLLLAVLVGLSTLFPYIGAVIVTVPILMVSMFQWGLTRELLYLVIAYAVILFLDANVLVPLLFSEAVNIHPVAIIVAVLIFGGIWGFWGVFFAIPLAILIKSIIISWPRMVK